MLVNESFRVVLSMSALLVWACVVLDGVVKGSVDEILSDVVVTAASVDVVFIVAASVVVGIKCGVVGSVVVLWVDVAASVSVSPVFVSDVESVFAADVVSALVVNVDVSIKRLSRLHLRLNDDLI